MRARQLVAIGAIALIGMLLVACEQKKDVPTAHVDEPPAPVAQKTQVTPPPEVDPYANDPLVSMDQGSKMTAADQKATKSAAPANKKAAAKSITGRTHTVEKGETLSSIAKKYYNDAGKWKVIWDANRTRVPDPNKLKVGTKLIIP